MNSDRQQWAQDEAALARQAGELAAAREEAREREEIARWQERLRAQRRLDDRWGPLEMRPYAELEALAKSVWARGVGTAWPSGWHVRWADLRRPGPDGIRAIARCNHQRKRITVEHAYFAARPHLSRPSPVVPKTPK